MQVYAVTKMTSKGDVTMELDSEELAEERSLFVDYSQPDLQKSEEDPGNEKLFTGDSTNIEVSPLPSTPSHGNESDQLLVSSSSGPSREVVKENHSVVLERSVTYKRVVFDNSDLSPDFSTQPKSPENNLSFIDSEQSESDSSDLEESPVVYYHQISKCFSNECSPNTIKRLADNWKSSFKANQSKATKVMMDLILRTAGSRCVHLHVNDAANMCGYSEEEIHSKIAKGMNHPDSQERPIFNEDYLERVSLFLTKALKVDSILLNQLFMKNIHHLIKTMILSTFSAVRHTATVFGAIMIRRLIKLQEKLAENYGEDQALSANQQYVISCLNKYMDIVLMSIRDIDPSRRLFMLDVLNKWFWLWPELFVKDYFLRLVTLLLYDPSSSVVTAAVRISHQLIISDKFTGRLDFFIHKTIPLLFKKIHDSSALVASAAVEAISAIARKVLDIAKYGNPDKILLQIFYNRPKVASKAAGFFYDMLHKYHSDSAAFIRESVKFLYKVEMRLDAECEDALVLSLFRHAPNQLTDWQAWLRLVQAPSTPGLQHLVPVTLRLLATVIRYINTFTDTRKQSSYPPVPPNADLEEVFPGGIKSNKMKELAKRSLEEMTVELGPQLLGLMVEHKHSLKCIMSLLAIPQHFLNVEKINLKKICIYLIKFPKLNSSLLMEEITKVLSYLYDAMKVSPKWKKEVSSLEKSLWSSISREFPTLCQELDAYDDQPLKSEKTQGKLLTLMCLSKYFDLSSTSIPGNALKAIELGIEKENVFLINCGTMICKNQAKWQLYNIATEKHSDMEVQSYLNKIIRTRAYVDNILALLEPLINHRITLVRDCAVPVMCSILGIFNSKNIHAKPFPPLHLPRPSLIVTEWLNFHLVQMVPIDRPPSKDEFAFSAATSVLSSFVSLLVGDMLPIAYLTSILPFFRFYLLESNYNDVLKDLKPLAEAKHFPSKLVKSLVTYHNHQSQYDLEDMTSGFCSVVVKKMTPADVYSKFILNVLNEGLMYVDEEQDLPFLAALTPFARIVPRAKVSSLKKMAEEHFHQQTENNFVCKFISAFGHHTPSLGFSSSQESQESLQSPSPPQ